MTEPAATLDLSLQIGKYEIQRALGRGATGMVYLARDTFTGNEVALKTIEPEVFRDPEFGSVYRTQFQNEASLAGKLRHPYIVAILDAVVAEDSGHIAMEYVKGGDLSKHVKPDNLLPVADVLQIAFKCCGALEYAAKEGVVHRDIKPANLMIAGGTDVKISDFGAAYLRRTQAVQTAAMGSPYYMSPEQIRGITVDGRSDQFSLAVIGYQLLAGKRPFTAESVAAILYQIAEEQPAPLSSLRTDLPRAVDAVFERALAKKREERYPSCSAFAEDLKAAIDVGARQKMRWWIALGLAAVVVVVVVLLLLRLK